MTKNDLINLAYSEFGIVADDDEIGKFIDAVLQTANTPIKPISTSPAAVAVPELQDMLRELRVQISAITMQLPQSIDCSGVWMAHDKMSAALAATPTAAPMMLPKPDAYANPIDFNMLARKEPTPKNKAWMFYTPHPELIGVYSAHTVRALLATGGQAQAVERGEVLVTVSGFTGSGKSAIAGEIEILCRALGLQVEWPDSDSEKHMTHADWTAALEQYKPRVRIVEQNIPFASKKGLSE